MTVLDRYVARSFFYGFAVALTVMMVLIVSLDLMVNLDEFTENKLLSGWEVAYNIWDYYSHQFFLYFAQLQGLMVLIAGCITIGRMTRANELTALLASGVPLQRVLRPIVVCAAICSALWVINAEWIIPNIAQKLTRSHDDPGGNRTLQATLFRVIEPPEPGRPAQDLLFNAARFYPYRSPPALQGMTVIHRDDGHATWHLRADLAWWDEARKLWRLERGIKFIPPDLPASAPADDLEQEATFQREEVTEFRTSLNPDELALRQRAQWIKFLSLGQLNQMARRPTLSKLQARELTLNRHARLTEPLVSILTAVIGCCFYLRRGPANLVIQSTKCLAVCGLIFVAQFGLRSEWASDVEFVAWLPVFLTAGIAGWVYGNLRS